MLINKGEHNKIENEIVLDEYLVAPIKRNEIVGKSLPRRWVDEINY